MLPAATPSGFWVFGIRYFVLEVRPPAHWRASAHFFSEISRLRFARDRGRGIVVPPSGPRVVALPFHPVGVWLLCRYFRPLVGFFIAGDAFVGWAPPDLYGDDWPHPPQCCKMLPCLDDILLSWPRFVRCHPPDGCLCV